MATAPKENQAKKRKKSHSRSHFSRNFVIVLLSIVVCVVAYMVYQVLTKGAVFPTTGTGIVVTQQTTSVNLEAEPTEPSTSASEVETEPSSETEPVTEPEELDPEELANELLDGLTLEEKVWQMMFVSPQALVGEAGTQLPVGGLYYPEETLTDTGILLAQLQNIQRAAQIPMLFGVAEEGGSIAPLYELGLTEASEPMRYYGELDDTNLAYQYALQLGQKLDDVGFHYNLAPVADVVTHPYNDNVGDRSFSLSASVASRMVSSMVSGMQEGGTIACLKHFPGLGSTAYDNGIDMTYQLLEDLREAELLPVQAGIEAGVEMVLVSNMAALNITGSYSLPCCMSSEVVTDLLRGELGFDGVILSDSLSENVIVWNYSAGDAALNAVMAGCDVVYLSSDPEAAVAAIVAAVQDGRLTEEQINESVYRILLLKCRYGVIAS